MSYEYLSENWLYRHKQNLELFRSDLDLIIKKDLKIYLSIDFYDIMRYCFPYPGLYSRNAKAWWNNKNMLDVFYRTQISRSTAFFLLEKIYKKPDFLLPPYMVESQEVLEYIRNVAYKIAIRGKDPTELQELATRSNLLLTEGNQDQLVDYLNENTPGLIYYFSRGLADGSTLFSHVLRSYFVDDIDIIYDNSSIPKIDILTIMDNLTDDQKLEFSDVKNIVARARNKDYKTIQNIHDAEAIYTTIRLNEMYNKYNKAFILISSAPHMNRMMKREGYNYFETEVAESDFRFLRGIDFFISALLSIGNYREISKDRTNLDEMDIPTLKKLRMSVSKEFYKLEDYFVYGTRGSGVILQQLKKDLSADLIGLSKLQNNVELSLLVNDFLPREISNDELIKNVVDYNSELYDFDQKRTAQLIREAFVKGTITDQILMRYEELEKEQLKYFLYSIRSRQKSLYVLLFSHPFRLNIKDNVASEIINSITKFNIKGKKEQKISGTESASFNEIINKIYALLKDLLERADMIEEGEKLILWQLTFLFLGRYNHVDDLYNLLQDKLSESQKIEASYLTAMNFIRKMRNSRINDKEIYLESIKLCNKYGCVYLGALKNSEDFESIESYLNRMHNLSQQTKSSTIINKRQINEKLCILHSIDNNIFVVQKNNGEMKLYRLDLRFIHLGSTIFNRVLCDFGCDNRSYQDHVKELFETIYIPIVEKFLPEFKIAIISDYAYLLSLDHDDEHHSANLSKALDLMIMLKVESNRTDDVYWGYVRNYIFGSIYLELSKHSKIKYKKGLIENSLNCFEESLKEIPRYADYLQYMANRKILECKNELKKSETTATQPRAASCGASKAPQHENGTR